MAGACCLKCLNVCDCSFACLVSCLDKPVICAAGVCLRDSCEDYKEVSVNG